MLVFIYFVLNYFSSRHLISEAIFSNDFLKNLEKFQVREIVSCMYPKEYDKDNYIINEGEIGHALFVISGNTHYFTFALL